MWAVSFGAARAQSPIPVPLGAAAQYGLLSGDSLRTNTTATALGRAGGLPATAGIHATDTVFAQGGGNVAQALTDLQAARNYCAGLLGQTINAELGGQTLGGGTYTVASAATCSANTTLTLTGDSATVVVLRVGGNLSFGPGCRVVLNGVWAEHVFWSVGGDVAFAAYADVSGVLLAGGGIRSQGVQYGRRGLLAAGKVRLNGLDDLRGTALFYSVQYLAASRSGIPCMVQPGPVSTGCENKVTNGGFEDYRRCPRSYANIVPLSVGTSDVCGFYSPGNGTPDYFNACANSSAVPPRIPLMGVPLNFVTNYNAASVPGLQAPAHNNSTAYASAASYTDTTVVLPRPDTINHQSYREFITQRFATALPAGRYYGEFWVRLASASQFSVRQLSMYVSAAAPRLPSYVSDINSPVPMPAPTLSGSPGPPNASTTAWVRISGVFTTTSALNYLTLGDFTRDHTSLPHFYPTNWGPGNYTTRDGAQYFYDDVAIYALPTAGLAQSLPCSGGTVTLGTCPALPVGTISYQWSPTAGLDNPTQAQTTAHPTQTTTYTLTVTVTNAAGTPPQVTTSQVTVTVPRPAVAAASLTQNIVCGYPATLAVACANPGLRYVWTDSNTGATATGSPVTVVPQAGYTVYSLTAFDLTTGTQVPVGQPQVGQASSVTVIVNNGQGCGTCGHPYVNNYVGNYYKASRQTPVAQQDYMLGEANTSHWLGNGTQIPVIQGNGINGPAMVFDGVYFVASPVEFQNGTFEVRPGTVFYAQGGIGPWPQRLFGSTTSCYIQPRDAFTVIRIGQNAQLLVNGATLTSTCNSQWGGIELVANGALETRADGRSRLRSEISQARVAVLVGTPCNGGDNNCLLTDTDFKNNLYGVASEGFPSPRDPDRNGVKGCTFTSSLSQILGPGTAGISFPSYTITGLSLHGKYHDGIEYANNTFSSVYAGAEVGGGTQQMRLHDNKFDHNYGVSIRVARFGASSPRIGTLPAAPVGQILLDKNTISLPSNPNPGGQVRAGDTIRGIQVLPLARGGRRLTLEQNNVQGTGQPGTAPHTTGLDAYFTLGQLEVQRQNQFLYLDEGIRLMDAGANTSQGEYISDNYFGKCDRDVVLRGGRYAPYWPYISCNTMYVARQGIAIEQGARTGKLSGPPNRALRYGNEPCANDYQNITNGVYHEGNVLLTYYYLDNRLNPANPTNVVENTSNFRGVYNPVRLAQTYGTSCATRPPYGPGRFGLNNRPGAGTTPDWQDWQEQITTNTADPNTLYELALQLISYYEDNGQAAQLEAFANTLPLQNDDAFDCFSLYLMEYYRQQGQDADAQRVRKNLLNNRGQIAEIKYRVRYYDVLDNLDTLAVGNMPATTDSTDLVTVAQSGTDFASVACATLQYFYPGCACSGGNSTSAPIKARPAGSQAPARQTPVRLQAYPTPSRDRLTVQAIGLSTATRFQLVELGSGREVRSAALAGTASAELNVADLAPGVYAGRALDAAGRVLGTCKVVVIH